MESNKKNERISMNGLMYDCNWQDPKLVAQSDKMARDGYAKTKANEYLDCKQTLIEKVKLIAKLIKESKFITIYSGAGISTASGIGDYASKASNSIAPHLQTNSLAKKNINRLELTPTKSHEVISSMERNKYISHWLQQNHDRLSQKAGFPQNKLNEIHGAWGDNKNSVKMMDDQLRDDLYIWMQQVRDVTDLCIAVGTSLCGMASDCIAQQAALNFSQGIGQGLVIVNLQSTPYDHLASVRVFAKLDDFFLLLANQLNIPSLDKQCHAQGQLWISQHPKLTYATPKRKSTDPI